MYILKKGQDNKFQDLIPLGDTNWPENVKKEICDFFKDAGVDDPMKQKLVEPALEGFRRKENGDEIDWEDVVAYFKYEALSVLIMHDKKFKAKAEKLYNEFFANHKFKVWNKD
ncbi:hypothetical protein [Desulfovibrio sp. UCD-KL4C]|uniref:hypothetical protein n=1 Tax=Desulfovibrio sp. UCD-KL4C TaxID=2578120 RepID=UPI0025C72760|nr:hypothetical protein [Desulfovibrio sp. UCD-KL4C]